MPPGVGYNTFSPFVGVPNADLERERMRRQNMERFNAMGPTPARPQTLNNAPPMPSPMQSQSQFGPIAASATNQDLQRATQIGMAANPMPGMVMPVAPPIPTQNVSAQGTPPQAGPPPDYSDPRHQVQVWHGDRMQQFAMDPGGLTPVGMNAAQQQFNQQQAAVPPGLQNALQPFGGQMPSYQQFMNSAVPAVGSGMFGTPYNVGPNGEMIFNPGFTQGIAQSYGNASQAYNSLLRAFPDFQNADTNQFGVRSRENRENAGAFGYELNGRPVAGSIQNSADENQRRQTQSVVQTAAAIHALDPTTQAIELARDAMRDGRMGFDQAFQQAFNVMNRRGLNINSDQLGAAQQYLRSELSRTNSNPVPGLMPDPNQPSVPPLTPAPSPDQAPPMGQNRGQYVPSAWSNIEGDLTTARGSGSSIGEFINNLERTKGRDWLRANIEPIQAFIRSNYPDQQIGYASAGTIPSGQGSWSGQTPLGTYPILDSIFPIHRLPSHLAQGMGYDISTPDTRGRELYRELLQGSNRRVAQPTYGGVR